MPRCVIFTAGDQHGIEKHEIGLRHDDFVICCDAGYRLAQRLGVRPDLLLGDFDSYTGALPERAGSAFTAARVNNRWRCAGAFQEREAVHHRYARGCWF